MFTFKETSDLYVNEKKRNSVYKKMVYIIISIFSLWKNKQTKEQGNCTEDFRDISVDEPKRV